MKTRVIPVNLGFVKAYLVKGDKTIVVDAGLKGSSKRILKTMQMQGIEPSMVSLLLVTHAHGDHVGGLKELKEITGAPVAVHASESEFLAGGAGTPAVLHSRAMKMLSVFMKGAKIDGVQADILIQDRLDLKPYGVDGYVFSTPGHTQGSLTLVTADGEAVTGDMVGGGRKPGIPGVYADLDALKASVARLAEHPIIKVYTSHAGVYEIGEVLKIAE